MDPLLVVLFGIVPFWFHLLHGSLVSNFKENPVAYVKDPCL